MERHPTIVANSSKFRNTIVCKFPFKSKESYQAKRDYQFSTGKRLHQLLFNQYHMLSCR